MMTTPPLDLKAADARVTSLICELTNMQLKQQIMDAWREGRVTSAKATWMIRECGLEDVPE